MKTSLISIIVSLLVVFSYRNAITNKYSVNPIRLSNVYNKSCFFSKDENSKKIILNTNNSFFFFENFDKDGSFKGSYQILKNKITYRWNNYTHQDKQKVLDLIRPLEKIVFRNKEFLRENCNS